jgi:ATP adenylyltransferase
MEHLWTPWRSTYMKSKKDVGVCVFCRAGSSPADDEENLVVLRASFSFVMLNRYPYTTGHLMIAPFQHAARLQEIPEETALEMMQLARRAEAVLQQAYNPDGLNIGLNLGEAAGAGIEQHLHLHALPRWKGDANFMTTIGETRIIPELLVDTYKKLKTGFLAL